MTFFKNEIRDNSSGVTAPTTCFFGLGLEIGIAVESSMLLEANLMPHLVDTDNVSDPEADSRP